MKSTAESLVAPVAANGRGPGGEVRLVRIGSVAVVHQPACVTGALRGRPSDLDGLTDLRVLPDHDDGGARSSITNASSSGVWRQFGGTESGAEARAREQHLLQPERVLSQPEHAFARADAIRRERAGELRRPAPQRPAR